MGKKFYRTNQYIRSQELRVIGEDEKQIGVLSLAEALERAKKAGLDLVEIAPMANPPVAKIVDFKKFLYQEDKKQREAKKKVKGGEIKGIRATPFIAKGDLDFRIKRSEEFLKEGNKVRVSIKFAGRQLGKKEFGYEILKKFIEGLSSLAQTEGEPKWMGRNLVLTFSPIKKERNEQKNEGQEISQTEIQNN